VKSAVGLGLGAGNPGTQRLMDEFEIESQPGFGTRISMVKWLPGDSPAGEKARRE
jgi:anti-sigma regulatory factor (Ser/Thr protein kinase)